MTSKTLPIQQLPSCHPPSHLSRWLLQLVQDTSSLIISSVKSLAYPKPPTLLPVSLLLAQHQSQDARHLQQFLSPIKSKRLFPRSEVVFTHSPDSEDVFSEPHQPMDVLTKTPGSPRPLTRTWLQRSSPPCFCPEAVFEILHG